MPGLPAQPHISLEPWCGQKASSSHWLSAATLLQPFASRCQETGLCGQLVPPGRWAEAKSSHCAWHLGCFCVCRQVAERERALKQPLPPHSPPAAGWGWQEHLGMMQSEGICAGLPVAPHKALGLNRLMAMPGRATHWDLLRVEPQEARTPHLGLPDPLSQRG